MNRQWRQFDLDHGTVQVVELSDGQCLVGYLSSKPGSKWQYWGLGVGGYEATVERFEQGSTFNPDGDPPPTQ